MNIVEWIAALTTIMSVFLLSRAKRSGWIFGIVACLIYGFVFIEQKLYANAILQLVFIGQGIHGIISWKKEIQNSFDFSSKKLDVISIVGLVALTLAFGIIISATLSLLEINKDSLLDVALSLCSVLAMTLMAKRVIQSWFVWMAVDIGYVCLFIYVGMWVSATLYLLLFFMCVDGYRQWNKKRIEVIKQF